MLRLYWRWRQAPCSHGLGGAASSFQSCAASSLLPRRHAARCPVALSTVIIASANETRRALPLRLHQHFASRTLDCWFAAADSEMGLQQPLPGGSPDQGPVSRAGVWLLLSAPALTPALSAQHLMLWWSDFQPELLEWCLVRPLQAPPLPRHPGRLRISSSLVLQPQRSAHIELPSFSHATANMGGWRLLLRG